MTLKQTKTYPFLSIKSGDKSALQGLEKIHKAVYNPPLYGFIQLTFLTLFMAVRSPSNASVAKVAISLSVMVETATVFVKGRFCSCLFALGGRCGKPGLNLQETHISKRSYPIFRL